MKRRLLSVLLVVVMLAALVMSGCSGDKGSSGTPTTSTDKSSTEQKTTESTFTGYPMNKKDTKLTWWVGTGYTLNEAFASYEESPFHMGLMDQTGVTIEWQFPTAGTDPNQAFNLMLASEDLPDIIFYSVMSDI